MSTTATPPKAGSVTAAIPHGMTAETFAAWVERPENVDRHFELEKGEVIELPPPKRLHGFVCANMVKVLGRHADTQPVGFVCSNDAGVIVERDPDTVRGPDVAYFDDVQQAEEILAEYAEVPPVIAVEVLSPDDRVNQVALKVDEYLAFGVKQVWVVDPEAKEIAIHRAGVSMRLLTHDEELSGGDDLPGFSCRVSDFFRLPGQKVT